MNGSYPIDEDDESDVVVARFDESDHPPSVAVAEALEMTLGEMDRTLFDYVNPDALDELVDAPSSRSSVTVAFEVDGAAVSVHGDGRVVVHTA